MFIKSLAAAVILSGSIASAAFDINCKNNLVMYWGQSSAGSEESLGDYCAKTAGDVYVVSFLNEFGTGSTDGTPGLNIGGCTTTFPGSSLLHCPSLASDIKSCQSAGKKVLLSLGGAVGSYGFSSDSQAEDFAGTLWNMFGGGSSDTRPFDDAVIDGFDLDIENNDSTGYVALVNKLRDYFNGASKEYYISAAPQCPFPDANVGDVLSNADIDFAFVQFYNNPCKIGSQFNYDTWENFAENQSPNKNIKIFLGLPGSPTAAGSGYTDPSDVASAVSSIASSSHFGGIMLWDASQGFSNTVDGSTFADQMQSILDDSATCGASPTTTSAAGVQTVSSGALGGETGLTLVASVPTTLATTSSPVKSTVTSTVTAQTVESTVLVTVQTTSTITLDVCTETVSIATASATATAGGSCTEGQTQCSDEKYAVCSYGSWVLIDCPAGTVCGVDDGFAFCGFPPSVKRDTAASFGKRHHVHQY